MPWLNVLPHEQFEEKKPLISSWAYYKVRYLKNDVSKLDLRTAFRVFCLCWTCVWDRLALLNSDEMRKVSMFIPSLETLLNGYPYHLKQGQMWWKIVLVIADFSSADRSGTSAGPGSGKRSDRVWVWEDGRPLPCPLFRGSLFRRAKVYRRVSSLFPAHSRILQWSLAWKKASHQSPIFDYAPYNRRPSCSLPILALSLVTNAL